MKIRVVILLLHLHYLLLVVAKVEIFKMNKYKKYKKYKKVKYIIMGKISSLKPIILLIKNKIRINMMIINKNKFVLIV